MSKVGVDEGSAAIFCDCWVARRIGPEIRALACAGVPEEFVCSMICPRITAIILFAFLAWVLLASLSRRCLADVGFHVIGVEIRPDVREKLAAGTVHFYEPGLDGHLRRATQSGRLEVHGEIPRDCKATVYVITVGTPLGPDGRVNLDSVRRIAGEIAEKPARR